MQPWQSYQHLEVAEWPGGGDDGPALIAHLPAQRYCLRRERTSCQERNG